PTTARSLAPTRTRSTCSWIDELARRVSRRGNHRAALEGPMRQGSGGSHRPPFPLSRIESAPAMIPLFLLGLAAGGPASGTWGWPAATPAAEGMSAAPLESLDRDLAAGTYGYVDSMLVIRHGKVVFEKTYDRSADYTRLFAGKGAPGIYNYYDPGWHPYYKGA